MVRIYRALEIERGRVIRPLNAARQAVEDEFVSANIYEIDSAIFRWHRFLEEVLGGVRAASRRAQNVDMCAVWCQNFSNIDKGRLDG